MLGNEDVIRQRIKELRQDAGLSQEKLGEYLHVDGNQIYLWESGKRNISKKSLLKYADFFNCTLDFLQGETFIKNSCIEDNLALNMIEQSLMLIRVLMPFKGDGLSSIDERYLRYTISRICRDALKIIEHSPKCEILLMRKIENMSYSELINIAKKIDADSPDDMDGK